MKQLLLSPFFFTDREVTSRAQSQKAMEPRSEAGGLASGGRTLFISTLHLPLFALEWQTLSEHGETRQLVPKRGQDRGEESKALVALRSQTQPPTSWRRELPQGQRSRLYWVLLTFFLPHRLSAN